MNFQPKKFVRIPNTPLNQTWVSLEVVKVVNRIAGPAAALAVYEDLGLPAIPRYLLPGWYQDDLFRD